MHNSLGTPNYSAIAFPSTAGVAPPANQYPDTAIPAIVIPLHVRSYVVPKGQTGVETAEMAPIVGPRFSASGGKTYFHGPRALPKLELEGDIDTPCVNTGDKNIPNVVIASTYKITYGELISLFFDGRLAQTDIFYPERVDPLWFRDPYGRVYNTPRLLDFTASYVEQIPGRTTFSMSMKV